MGRYVLGIDAGTESIRCGVFDEQGRCLGFGVGQNATRFPHPGWAEQSPTDWERALVESIREAIRLCSLQPEEIVGIGVDGTSCTVVLLDEGGAPIRDAIMWMDIRASEEALEIGRSGEAALKYVGFGNVSPEWFPPKLLWLKRHESESYRRAATVFEETDWLAFRLTGERTVSIDTLSIRWFADFREGGLPLSLFRRIGIEDVIDKVPTRVVKVGEVVGGLSREMAERTSLRAGIPVAGGAADAYMGVIGVNVLRPGKLALITGSSQLQVAVTDKPIHAKGLFGSFPDALIDGPEIIEAGQVSTGSVMRWFTSGFVGAEVASRAQARKLSLFDLLDEEAAELPPGSDGIIVLEHWQGNRTPWTDPTSRGVIRGLTLSHTPAHLYRAIMEGIVYGTQVIIERMEAAGVEIREIIACGGATKSNLWMQIHADVTGKPITIPEEQQAVALGSAIAATVAAGLYRSIEEAASRMVRTKGVVSPSRGAKERYGEFVRQYIATYDHLAEDSRRLVRHLERER